MAEPKKYLLLLMRTHVEALDLSPVLDLLNRPTITQANPRHLIGCLSLFIDGYDDDPRELHEVEAVRAFFRELERQVPHILFYLSPDHGSVNLFCAAAWAKSQAEGQAYIPVPKLSKLLEQAYHAMNCFCEQIGLDAQCEEYGRHCQALAQVLSANAYPCH